MTAPAAGCVAATTTRTWAGGRDDHRFRDQTQTARDERRRTARRVRTARRTDRHAPEPCRSGRPRGRQRVRRIHRREDPTPGQTGRTVLPAGRPAHHRPRRGARARPRRARRTRRRQLPRTASERRVPGSHRIGQVVPAMRVGEIRVQGTLPGLLHTDARPHGTGRGRGPQAGRSGQKLVRKYSAYTLLAIDEWLVDKPDERFRRFLLELMDLCYGNAGTAFAPPVGDQGMAQPSRRRHHRRRHPRPHRAQHGMNRHRRVQHEATARTIHARILTIKGASGLDSVRHWPSLAITVALKGNNQWP